MPTEWKFEDIQWSLFDFKKVDPTMLRIIKAASVVEHNGSDYGLYLKNVFAGDTLFEKEIEAWAKDEIKHGKVLAEWVKMVDPTYNFEEQFKAYVKGFPIAVDTTESIRGSRASELLARCMVEIGTSSLYTAMQEACHEPLLKHICTKIAADEFRHYKLFYTHFQRYQSQEKLSFFKRFRVSLGRLLESDDDELAFAYYTANAEKGPYNRKRYTQLYGKAIFSYYRRAHINQAMAMFCKAVGVSPQGWLYHILSFTASKIFSLKTINITSPTKFSY
jgi:rubrerythrin